MPRGFKTCPNCSESTGPRAFKCPKCDYDYKEGSKTLSTLDNQKEEVINPLTKYAGNDKIS